MTDTSDAQLLLKKRARRRLVGAAAFAGLAAIVLPMVMDEEPKAPAQDVQIRIPSLDQTPFSPGQPVAAAQSAKSTKDAAAASAPPAIPAAASMATATAAAPVQALPVLPAGEKPAALDKAKAADKPPAPAPEAAKESSKPPPAREVRKDAVKEPVKESTKESTKEQAKDAAKGGARAADKPADSARTADDARRAAAILGGKATAAAAVAAPANDSAPHVILIGAFANAANVRQLQAKLGELAIKTYTEALESPQGTKTRLRAGPFANREAAEKALDRMKRIGVSGVVAAKQ